MADDNSNHSAEFWQGLLDSVEEQSKQYQSKQSGNCTVCIQPDRLKATLAAFWPPERSRTLALSYENGVITLAVVAGVGIPASIQIPVTSEFRGDQRLAEFESDLLNARQLAKRILERLTQPY